MWTEVLPYIGSGAIGGAVTFGLNWAREQRRMKDAYRAPQRHAIGEILAAGHELQLRVLNWRRAMADLIEAIRQDSADRLPAISAEIREVERAQAVAMLDLRRAFEVGHLTIVDAQCWEAMVAAAAVFEQFHAILNEETVVVGPDDTERLNEQLGEQATQLRAAMTALIQTANDRLTPVETGRNRRQRQKSQRRLTDDIRARNASSPATPET